MSLAQKAGKAGLLLFARKIWGGLVNIGVMAYLARTLNKEDFGLVAISGVLIGFVQVFALSGIGEYVVFYQGKKDEKEVVNAAFWLNLILTIAVACIVLIAAPFWARSYDDARILNLIWLLLIGFVFSSLSTMPNALFRKELNYAPMIKIQTIFGTLSQLSQVLFAWLGFGVYALALPNAIITPLLAITLFWVSGFRPSKHLGRVYWAQIFSYTKSVIGARVLGKFSKEGDTILVGKLLGMKALGIYDIAFRFANLLNRQLGQIVSNVALPVLAKTNNDMKIVLHRFVQMLTLLSGVFIPLYLLLISISPELITLLYGEKWREAILPVQIMSVFALVRSISSPTSGLYNALGKPHIGFYFTLFFAPIMLLSVCVSSFWGLISVCLTVTVVRVLGSSFHFFLANKLIGLTFNSFFNIILPFLFSGVVALIVSYFSVSFVSVSVYVQIFMKVFTFFVVFVFVFRLFFFSCMVNMFNLLYKIYSI